MAVTTLAPACHSAMSTTDHTSPLTAANHYEDPPVVEHCEQQLAGKRVTASELSTSQT